MFKTGDYNSELAFKRWDDYIIHLHNKLEEIGGEAEQMFYISGKVNKVCTMLMVLYSRNSSYITNNKIKSDLVKIYENIHSKSYLDGANLIKRGKKSPYFEKTRNDSIIKLLNIIEIINIDLSNGELNPKPIQKKKKLSEIEQDPEKKLELEAMEFVSDS